jgi:hypothetical protein
MKSSSNGYKRVPTVINVCAGNEITDINVSANLAREAKREKERFS